MAAAEYIDDAPDVDPRGGTVRPGDASVGGLEPNVAAGLDQPEVERGIDHLVQRELHVTPGGDGVDEQGVRRVVSVELGGQAKEYPPGRRGVQVLAAGTFHQHDPDRVGSGADRAGAGLNAGEAGDRREARGRH